MLHFIFLKKFKCDFVVAMNYLHINYGFSLLDFKIYCPNMITNKAYINHHQKAYRDYKLSLSKIIIKLKKTQTTRNKEETEKDNH